ncbi:MAG: HigA family addiction module antidote protein [Desulfurellaceae bacterium]|nr:HigA family addiction module antidote protein [Desulfurellaceae bacterium]
MRFLLTARTRPRPRAIVHGQRSITAETALLFSRFFDNSAEFWMGLQSQYDLEREQDRLADRLDQVPKHHVQITA